MIKPKIYKPVSFKGLDNQQVVDLVNNELPISLKYNEDLINRVHNRYPLVDKIQISIVIKTVFKTLRDLLILGKTININNLFSNAKIITFAHRRNGAIFPSLRVKISTPSALRKHVE